MFIFLIKQQGSWISTGGSYSGVMKCVGEAVKENAFSLNPNEKIVVLGIANWCSVARNEELIKDPVSKAALKSVLLEFINKN
jgi:hypothetical protein